MTALRAVHSGETVVSPQLDAGRTAQGDWPGREEGLTAREAEVIALITQGYSNSDIAAMASLSINSVKSYIRSSYRKMGVASRTNAVLWGLDHGMSPDRMRVRPQTQPGPHHGRRTPRSSRLTALRGRCHASPSNR